MIFQDYGEFWKLQKNVVDTDKTFTFWSFSSANVNVGCIIHVLIDGYQQKV